MSVRRALFATICRALAYLTLAQPMLARADADNAQADAAAQYFDEARALMEQGEYTRACPKLEASQQLDPQLGTQLHLGHCFEKLGQLSAAYRTFEEAAQLAAHKHDAREKLARERVESLAARLSLLEVRPSDPAPRLTITIDGTPIERAQWNRAVAVEPGDHVLHASAPGRESWQQAFAIGAPARLAISVPALTPQTASKLDVRAPAAALSTMPTRAPPTAAAAAPAVQRIIGYVALGAGVAGLGLGTAFGLLRNSRMSQLENDCNLDTGHCSIASGDNVARSRIESLHSQAGAFAAGANLAWILGGVAAASGVVLILTAPREESPALTLSIAPGGLSLTAHTDAL